MFHHSVGRRSYPLYSSIRSLEVNAIGYSVIILFSVFRYRLKTFLFHKPLPHNFTMTFLF